MKCHWMVLHLKSFIFFFMFFSHFCKAGGQRVPPQRYMPFSAPHPEGTRLPQPQTRDLGVVALQRGHDTVPSTYR